ncbi:hypothetical protein GpartN1_g1227.t1 [Galdieria partita]|uniref:Uncharacterized protein n=1 Tax=Galdieria partita TaxID=83374 RepID=A0A9C7PT88_9RHOD|nr:hypothetical protein GpartN1_g1227.t1 [Galdieria partita]
MLKRSNERHGYFDETPRASIEFQEETEEDFLALIEREVFEAERRLQMYNLEEDERTQDTRRPGNDYFNPYTVNQRESFTENNATHDFSKGSFAKETVRVAEQGRGERNSRKNCEPENPFDVEVNKLASPEPYKRLLDSNPATKRSANVKLHKRNVILEDSASQDALEHSIDKRKSVYSASSNEAILQGQQLTEEKTSLLQLLGNGTEEHYSQEGLLRECKHFTKDSEVDFEELYSSIQLQLKKTQTRLAQTESTLSSLQVEYDILNNSFESASQEVEGLQIENSELRAKLSKLMSTKDNGPSVTDSENVYRWRTLFQKAVTKLAEERQLKVKAENEKKRALRELEIFEEDIMKRFIVLRNQAKNRVKEMKAWTNQMEQIKELLETVPPKLRIAHTNSNEIPKSINKAPGDRQHTDINRNENQSVNCNNADATNSRRVETAETVQVDASALNRAEKELASEHETEKKLLEHWRADAQKLIENFQLFQEENLLQPASKPERLEKLKKGECRYR